MCVGSLLWSCNDDLNVAEGLPEQHTEGIKLMIPNIRAAAEFPNSRATSAVSSEEGKVNDLYLYVFKKEENGNNFTIVEDLSGKDIVNDLKNSQNSYQEYKLVLGAGTYKFYLLGNVENYTTGLADLKTIEAIEDLTLDYSSNYLTANNLPMICKSAVNTVSTTAAAEGSTITISKEDSNKSIYCDLSFLCSKVRYTILFDKTPETGAAKSFGNRAPDFDGPVTISDVLKSTPVKEAKTSWPEDDYLSGNKTGILTEYPYPANASYPTENNNSDLTGEAPGKGAVKRAWQGIVYLPENTNASKKSKITFTGAVYSDATSNEAIYTIEKTLELIPQHNCSTGNNNHGIYRGYMYDVTATLQTYEVIDLTVSEKEWTPQDILVDFAHTYLEIERTTASVTSTLPDVIGYSTDGRGGVGLQCINPENLTKDNGEKITTPVIIISEVNPSEGTITLIANSDLNVNEVAAEGMIGQAVCYITAGNIKKQIKVHYDLNAFFRVVAESITFNWGDKGNQSTLPAQEFTFETNLGGLNLYISDEAGNKGEQITFSPGSDYIVTHSEKVMFIAENGESQEETSEITLRCKSTDTAKGTITVSSNTADLTHVIHHYFLAEAKTQFKEQTFSQLLMVSVIPSQGNYRVYFRAINDYQIEYGDNYDKRGTKANEFLEGDWSNFPTESYKSGEGPNDNWKDWWDAYDNWGTANPNSNKTPGSTIQKSYHNIYVYGQVGESGGGFTADESWQFNNYDKGGEGNLISQEMDGDYNNPGWYFKDISAGLSTTTTKNNTESITPGKTLFIFHNRNYGCSLHRFSHHNDPGVPLFNYEDREGWYLYDPTREPYYNVYDNQPAIEDVIYQFYTKDKPKNWYRNYGVASGVSSYDPHSQYVMLGSIKEASSVGIGQTVKDGEYYVTQLKFKAPKGEYQKNIKIGGQVIYCCDQMGWNITPIAHFYKGNNVYDDWNEGTKGIMTRIANSPTGNDTDKPWWMIMVPEGWEDSQVIIHNIYPRGEEWTSSDPLNGKTGVVILKSDKSADWSYEDTFEPTTIMGGQNFFPQQVNREKIIYGYYDNGRWFEGKPSGY